MTNGHFLPLLPIIAHYYYICSRYTPIIPHFAVKTYHMRARSSNVTHTHVCTYARVLVRTYAHARIRYRVNSLTFYNVFCQILLVYCLCCVNTCITLTYTCNTFKMDIVKRDTATGQRHAWEVTPDSCTGHTPGDTWTHDARGASYLNIGCGKKQSSDGAFHTVKSHSKYRAVTVQGDFRNLKNQ